MLFRSGVLSGTNLLDEFMLAGDKESQIDLVKEAFPYPHLNIINNYLMELSRQQVKLHTTIYLFQKIEKQEKRCF